MDTLSYADDIILLRQRIRRLNYMIKIDSINKNSLLILIAKKKIQKTKAETH